MDITSVRFIRKILSWIYQRRRRETFLIPQSQRRSWSISFLLVSLSFFRKGRHLLKNPFLVRYWPEWLPGGGFKTIARQWAKQLQDTVDVPFEFVKDQLVCRPGPSNHHSCNSNFLGKWDCRGIFRFHDDSSEARRRLLD